MIKQVTKGSKRWVALLLTVMLMISSFPMLSLPAVAESESGSSDEGSIVASGTTGDCTWALDSDGMLIIAGKGKTRDYDHPGAAGAWYSPWYCNGTISNVIIDNGVTSIGDYAFYGCSGLTSITIPDSVTSIGRYAFNGCTGLTSITIPNSVTSIGGEAFSGCTGLTSITIPDSVTSIGNYAFEGCTGLTSITIPNSVTSIGGEAFNGCTGLKYNVYQGGKYLGNDENPYVVLCDTVSTTITAFEFAPNVKLISNYAFEGCTKLTSITIPDSVTSIGSSAFYGCSGLTSITIPNSVTSIGGEAFSGCTGLTSITIPDSVTSIGNYAFVACTGLTSITIPDSVTSIGDYAFNACTGLTSITIPDSVTSIGDYAFNGCTGLKYNVYQGGKYLGNDENPYVFLCDTVSTTITAFEFAPNVKLISNYAFEGCTKLTSITIPNGVTSIGYKTFYGCSGLTSITIPDSVTSIDRYAFNGCSGLTSITIPDSVTWIGYDAFAYCTGLTSVTISCNVYKESLDHVTNEYGSWDYATFTGCTHLTDVIISDDVTYVSGYLFSNHKGLTSLTTPMCCYSAFRYAGFHTIKNVTLTKGGTTLDSSYFGNSTCTTVVLPNTITTINDQAFSDCTNLTSITIPDSVTSIGGSAFSGCTSLKYNVYQGGKYLGNDENPYVVLCDTVSTNITSFELASGTKLIMRDAFSGCTSLTSITIPDSVAGIGYSVFYDCTNLKYNVYQGGKYLGNDENPYVVLCGMVSANITSFEFAPGTKLIREKAFYGCTGLTSITIPDSVTSIGYNVFKGCTGLTSITIPDSVTSIGNYAFEGCTGLTSITIPDSVTSIGSSAFYGCTGLTSITIPDSVTSIGSSAFYGCTGLTSITIPDSVTSIGSSAFYGCSGLTSITIPDSVTSIGDYAFNGCTGLTSITIPNSVTSIGGKAFSGCTGLTSITIPDSVTSIGNYAFEGCTGLTSITIPDSVTSIGYNVFKGCTGLTSITIPNSVTSIGSSAFYGCTGLTSITIPGRCTLPYCWEAFKDLLCVTLSDGTRLCNGCFKDNTSIATVVLPNTLTMIGNSAFYGCTKLTSITIPNSVTSIGDKAFSGCTNLTSITIPNSVTSIGNYAFEGCTGLASVTMSNSVTSIGDSAFRGCNCLTNLVLPDSVTSIGDFALSGCTSLTDFKIPNNVTSIGDSAFSGCTNLKSITIPGSVTSIGENAFNGCENLRAYLTVQGGTTLTINESILSCIPSLGSKLKEVNLRQVGTIPEYAFENCTELTAVYFSKELTEIGEGAFIDSEAITDVYFAGSEADWNRVTIGVDNDAIEAATMHFNASVSAIDAGGKALYETKSDNTVRVTLQLNDGYLPVPGSISYTTVSGKTVKVLNKSLNNAGFGTGTGLEYEFEMPDEEIDRINVTYRSTADTSFAVDTVGTSLHVATDGGCDGIRFLTRLYFGSFKATSNTLRVNYNGTRYTVMEFGTLIKRAENETELTVANVEASTATGANRMWKSVAYTEGDDMKLVDYTDAYVDFSAVMMRGSKVSEATFNARSYTARGYMKLKASNGTELVIECDSEVTNSINATQALM